MASSAMVGTGGCSANEDWVCTLTDGTSVFMYCIPKSFCDCLVLLYCHERGKNITSLPSPTGKRDLCPKQNDKRTPVRCLVGFTRGLHGVAEHKKCWGEIQALCPWGCLSPCQVRCPQGKGGLQSCWRILLCAVALDGAGSVPNRAVCPPAVVTVYVRQ